MIVTPVSFKLASPDIELWHLPPKCSCAGTSFQDPEFLRVAKVDLSSEKNSTKKNEFIHEIMETSLGIEDKMQNPMKFS